MACSSKVENPTEPIDPNNRMPLANILEVIPDHDPEAGNLGLQRQSSSIPKNETNAEEEEKTWTYPSERMFYNALRRKGYEPSTDEIAPMLAVHNFLNEAVWEEIKKWESLHDQNCMISLERFWGRFGDWSPRSWFFVNVRNSPTPFDRHDWVVKRCNGESIRYIIDYYPSNEGEAIFNCDIRPALDSFSAIKLYFSKWASEFKDRK
jgi:cytochrome c heme-lyase